MLALMFSRLRTIVGLLAVLMFICGTLAFAQEAPRGQGRGEGGGAGAAGGGGGRGGNAGGGGTGAARVATAALIFKVEWVQPAGQTGQVPIVQGNVADANVELESRSEENSKRSRERAAVSDTEVSGVAW